MLEKDPSKRLSARRALQHVYFTSGSGKMDVEETAEKRSPFKEMSYNSFVQASKCPEETRSVTPSNRSGFSFGANFQVNNKLQENRRVY